MLNLFSIVFLLITLASLSQSQSISALMTLGDSAVQVRNAVGALKAYESAIAKDSANLIALRKAAKTLVSLAEFESDTSKRREYTEKAERYARSAFVIDSTSAESHFVMAQALGRTSQLKMAEGLKNGPIILDHAVRCLAVEPNHGGCFHVIGAWHAELSKRGAMARSMAAILSKNEIYRTANWDSAQVYLERAVTAEPEVVIHRLTLGRIYRDRDKPDPQKARVQLEAAIKAPIKDFNDERYQKQAKEELQKIGQ